MAAAVDGELSMCNANMRKTKVDPRHQARKSGGKRNGGERCRAGLLHAGRNASYRGSSATLAWEDSMHVWDGFACFYIFWHTVARAVSHQRSRTKCMACEHTANVVPIKNMRRKRSVSPHQRPCAQTLTGWLAMAMAAAGPSPCLDTATILITSGCTPLSPLRHFTERVVGSYLPFQIKRTVTCVCCRLFDEEDR